jgi:hypothetical protein
MDPKDLLESMQKASTQPLSSQEQQSAMRSRGDPRGETANAVVFHTSVKEKKKNVSVYTTIVAFLPPLESDGATELKIKQFDGKPGPNATWKPCEAEEPGYLLRIVYGKKEVLRDIKSPDVFAPLSLIQVTGLKYQVKEGKDEATGETKKIFSLNYNTMKLHSLSLAEYISKLPFEWRSLVSKIGVDQVSYTEEDMTRILGVGNYVPNPDYPPTHIYMCKLDQYDSVLPSEEATDGLVYAKLNTSVKPMFIRTTQTQSKERCVSGSYAGDSSGRIPMTLCELAPGSTEPKFVHLLSTIYEDSLLSLMTPDNDTWTKFGPTFMQVLCGMVWLSLESLEDISSGDGVPTTDVVGKFKCDAKWSLDVVEMVRRAGIRMPPQSILDYVGDADNMYRTDMAKCADSKVELSQVINTAKAAEINSLHGCATRLKEAVLAGHLEMYMVCPFPPDMTRETLASIQAIEDWDERERAYKSGHSTSPVPELIYVVGEYRIQPNYMADIVPVKRGRKQ